MVRSENKLTATASTPVASTTTARAAGEKLRSSKSIGSKNSINNNSSIGSNSNSKFAVIQRRRRVSMVRSENKPIHKIDLPNNQTSNTNANSININNYKRNGIADSSSTNNNNTCRSTPPWSKQKSAFNIQHLKNYD